MATYQKLRRTKMKLWGKIYIITLALFILLINVGFFTVFNMTYDKDMNTEKTIAKSSYEMIVSSLTKSMKTMYEDNRLEDKTIKALVTLTEQYYISQGITLMVYTDDGFIYSKDNREMDKKLFKDGKILLTKVVENEIPVIYITESIDDFNNKYYICFRKPLGDLKNTWDELQEKYMLMSLGCSGVLAILLFIVLHRLMRPIEELSKAVAKVKQEGYDTPSRVKVKGHDDIARLGQNFNDMSDIIADNIKKIRLENEKKQQFVDNFAHELKSPLTSIYGFAEYVSMARVPDEEKEECMRFIMDESNRMLEMAYNLMDLSEIRNKEVNKDYFDAKIFRTKLENILKDRLSKKNVTLNLDVNVSKIYGNEGLIESLVSNIIANGINASKENGKIDVTICKEDNKTKFVIRDYGCGMSEEELQHIFEPFYRADKARSRKNGSTGLGLSVCKQIVEAHEGSIVYESEKGKGTKVTICIPEKL